MKKKFMIRFAILATSVFLLSVILSSCTDPYTPSEHVNEITLFSWDCTADDYNILNRSFWDISTYGTVDDYFYSNHLYLKTIDFSFILVEKSLIEQFTEGYMELDAALLYDNLGEMHFSLLDSDGYSVVKVSVEAIGSGKAKVKLVWPGDLEDYISVVDINKWSKFKFGIDEYGRAYLYIDDSFVFETSYLVSGGSAISKFGFGLMGTNYGTAKAVFDNFKVVKVEREWY